MWTAIFAAIPGIGSIVTAITAKIADSKVRLEMARLGVGRDVAIASMQNRVAGLQVIAGSKLLTCLVIVFATPLVIFEFKVIVWDIVLGWGSTDAIRGQVADWANTIIACLFGSAATLTVSNTVASIFGNLFRK